MRRHGGGVALQIRKAVWCQFPLPYSLSPCQTSLPIYSPVVAVTRAHALGIPVAGADAEALDAADYCAVAARRSTGILYGAFVSRVSSCMWIPPHTISCIRMSETCRAAISKLDRRAGQAWRRCDDDGSTSRGDRHRLHYRRSQHQRLGECAGHSLASTLARPTRLAFFYSFVRLCRRENVSAVEFEVREEAAHLGSRTATQDLKIRVHQHKEEEEKGKTKVGFSSLGNGHARRE